MAETNRPEPEVAIVFTPEPWVGELHRFLADHGGARVREIIMDQRLALEDDFSVLVVSHRWPALTRSFVKQLHERQRVVLGVYDGEEATSRVFLSNLGADGVVASTASMPEFLHAIQAVAPTAINRDHELAGLEVPAAHSSEPGTVRGSIVVLGGPAGAGRTELACALQAAATNRGATSVLVDADDRAPAVAQRLGCPIEPNIRTAIDATAFGLGTIDATLQTTTVGPVLCGLPNVGAWSQVRATEVTEVIHELARRFDPVIVDIGPDAEDLESVPRGRNEIARALLATADRVILVAAANPRGIARAVSWTAELRALVADVPVHGVLNLSPRDRFRRAECADELSRTIGFVSLHTVPRDSRVDHAHWNGTPVGRSAFAKSVAAIDATILAPRPEEPVVDLTEMETAAEPVGDEVLGATA